MNRREFATLLASGLGAAGAGLALPARAQGSAPIEGTHYVRLSQPLPVTPGKIDVVEFFSYACPHCNAFEPTLEAWERKLPADVNFHRVPVPFLFNAENFQRLYYALESMGLVQSMQRKVFYAVHGERQRLDKPADIAAFMQRNGVDSAKFMDSFNSFGVQAKVKQAARLAEGYKVDGVPTLGVQGKYFTSGSLAGSVEAALGVTDYLIQRERKGG